MATWRIVKSSADRVNEIRLTKHAVEKCDCVRFPALLRSNGVSFRTESLNQRSQSMKKLSALSTILACLFACIAGAQEKDGPAPKLDEAAIEKLVGQLKSTDFKTRQLAEKELLKLEDIPAP